MLSLILNLAYRLVCIAGSRAVFGPVACILKKIEKISKKGLTDFGNDVILAKHC